MEQRKATAADTIGRQQDVLVPKVYEVKDEVYFDGYTMRAKLAEEDPDAKKKRIWKALKSVC